MKSPDRSTRTKLKTDAASRVAAVLPWGQTPGRQVVEQAGKPSAVRARLKLATGTRYENGSVIRVTRTWLPSCEASTARTMVGAPSVFTARVRISISAT